MESLTLDRVPRAVTTARHWVVDACRRWGLDDATCDPLELVTAEMVGNAVKHGEGRIDLSLDGPTAFPLPGGPDQEASPSVLVVSVTDAGAARPLPRQAGDGDTSGRGLALVDALTVGWGVTSAMIAADGVVAAPGKTTWALVPVVPVSSADAPAPTGTATPRRATADPTRR